MRSYDTLEDVKMEAPNFKAEADEKMNDLRSQLEDFRLPPVTMLSAAHAAMNYSSCAPSPSWARSVTAN